MGGERSLGAGGGSSLCTGPLSGPLSATISVGKFLWSVLNGMALIQTEGHITTVDELADNGCYSFRFDFQTTGDVRSTTRDAASGTVTSASLILCSPSGAGLWASRRSKSNDTGAMVGSASLTIPMRGAIRLQMHLAGPAAGW